MNWRRLIFLLIALFLIGFVWWLASRRFAVPVTQVQSTPAPKSETSPAPAPLTLPVQAEAEYEVPAGGAVDGLSDPRWQWWNRMDKIDPSFEWKMPINFYGRVVDQDNLPVPNAKIRYGWNDVEGSHEQYTTSDTKGLIRIEGLKGKRLSVDVSKDGYHSSTRGLQSFEYAAFFEPIYHRPDPENPVTFRLVKKLEAEPIISKRAAERVGYDQPSYYDLERGGLTQQQPAGAALKLTFERSESPQGQPFDWKWKVEAVNGVLMETKDEFAQVAPEEGYAPAWESSQKATDQAFRKNGQARFYIRTADNRFARVDVELAHPNSRGMGPRLTINSFLNPSGSRNLEYYSIRSDR
jgi:hypothetical protein